MSISMNDMLAVGAGVVFALYGTNGATPVESTALGAAVGSVVWMGLKAGALYLNSVAPESNPSKTIPGVSTAGVFPLQDDKFWGGNQAPTVVPRSVRTLAPGKQLLEVAPGQFVQSDMAYKTMSTRLVD